METSLLLFGFGLITGYLVFAALLSLRRFKPNLQRSLSRARRRLTREVRKLPRWAIWVLSLAFLSASLAICLELLSILHTTIELIFFPHVRAPWDPAYLLYAKLSGTWFTQFALGLLVG